MDQIGYRPDDMAGYLDFLMHRRRVESSSTLLQHFGFREDPFRVNPDARYLFPSETHLQALAALESGFYNNRGFIAMIAPPGMGKTSLLYRFLEDTKDTARSTFIFDIDAGCEPRDFVGYILRDFGINPAASSSEMHKQLSEALENETAAGRKCVVVIDEAQNLSDAVLERVRLLTNFENSQGKLLQIILSGQPQLTDKLMNASLVQLRQRVSTICHLNLLTHQETKDYIDYRLVQAGYDGPPLFTDDALDLIAESGGGTPRTINNICFNTLAMCSTLKCAQADRTIVAKVVESMELGSTEDSSHKEKGLFETDLDGEPWARAGNAGWLQAAGGEVRIWVPLLIGTMVFAGLIVAHVTGFGGAQTLRPQFASPSVQRANTALATDAADDSTEPKPASKVVATAAVSTPSSNVSSTSKPAATSVPATSIAGRALLTIESNPPGADIEIDGKFVGNAPSSVSVAPGSHQVYVEMKNYKSWNKVLTVTGGRIHLNAELESASQ